MSVEENINTRERLIVAKCINKTNNMLNKKNTFFYISVILINIATLLIAGLIEGGSVGSVDIVSAFAGFNFNYLYLIAVVLLLRVLFIVFPDFLILLMKTKKRKFIQIANANMINTFYNNVTFGYMGGNSPFVTYLKNTGFDEKCVLNICYNKNIFKKISLLLYSFVVIILGCIFAFNNMNIFLFVLGIIAFLLNILIVLFILYFDRNKEKYLRFIAWVSRLLFKLKIVKNYENFYKTMIENLLLYNTAMKYSKLGNLLLIIFNILQLLLKHILVFIIFGLFNNFDYNLLLEILFKCSLLELIVQILPLPNGLFLYEFLFLNLFRNVFFSGYVVYGMVVYRIINYFIIMIISSLFFVSKKFRKYLVISK